MEDILKGNFETKNKINGAFDSGESDSADVTSELKKKVMASLGGSMVFVERDLLVWDGKE